MALSDDKLWDLWNAQGTDDMSGAEAFVFARAVEAAVRKDDEALIRQLESALSWSSPHADAAYGWKCENWARRRSEAITAARARLAPPPTA